MTDIAHILVIDDTEASLTVISAGLEGFGFAVTCTTDPIEGLTFAQSGKFHLAIVDLRMPVIDGMQFTQMLRKAEQELGRAPIPLLALTADQRSGIKKNLLKNGVNAYMEKPYDMAELHTTIRGLLVAA